VLFADGEAPTEGVGVFAVVGEQHELHLFPLVEWCASVLGLKRSCRQSLYPSRF
jgi:hypothetical protein